ncbi:hypothetical protein ABMA75_08160 [Halobacteriovorax sp. ZH4_bin.1]|uniref:hypothetical protein n=1 Tax=unclassified Halobacteriovorax TaxID=2639665 RepID=UPI0037146043
MKKVFLGAATLALLSTSAYATKARLLALGDEVEDNYYTMDDRYIFTNASFVNNFGDMVVLEYGEQGVGAGYASLDADSDPKAMGGFFKKMGNFTYGVYLGNESNISSSLRILATNQTPALLNNFGYLATADNQVDLFIGGKAGVNWGASFVYASSENEIYEDSAMALRIGANKDNWDAYANISLKSESENLNAAANGNKFDGTLGVQVGGSYTLNQDTKFYGSYKTFSWDQVREAQEGEGDLSRLDLGVGKEYKVDGGMVFIRTAFQMIDVEVKDPSTNTASLETMNLPVIIGVERKANDWLTLRGSVSQSIYSNADSKGLATYATAANELARAVIENYNGSFIDGEASFENTTRVNLGATLTYKTVDIDVYTGSNGEDTDSRVAMKYNF